MIAIGQFYEFLLAVTIGIFSGGIYELNCLCRFFFKHKSIIILADILFFILFAASYIFFATVFALPNFRLYLAVGTLAGFWLYYKSMHKIVAFLAKKCYSKYKSIKSRRKLCKQKKQKER